MRLIFKLSLTFSVVAAGLLCGFLLLSFRGQARRLDAAQDDRIGRAVRACAALCVGAVRGVQGTGCLDRMQAAIEDTSPEGFVFSLLLDESGKPVLEASRLPPGMIAGGMAGAPYAYEACRRDAPRVQRSDFGWKEAYRVYSAPVAGEGGTREGTLLFAFSERRLGHDSVALHPWAKRKLVQAALAGVAFGALLALGLASYLIAPLRELEKAAQRIAAGDFSGRVPSLRNDEFGDIAQGFNRMTERLGELDRLKDGFLAKVTHDFRNPLNALLGIADNLAAGYRGALSDGQREAVSEIGRSAKALEGLVGRVLDVSRVDAGRQRFSPCALDAGEEVASAVDALSAAAAEYGVSLSADASPGCAVFADPEQLRRVLHELIRNALSFTPGGGTVRVSVRPKSGEAVFTVSDTGIGIPAERQRSLFEKFYQVPETKNKVRPGFGSGLGLYLCKKLVEGQGGRIWMQSGCSKGSQFSFALPSATPGSGSLSPG